MKIVYLKLTNLAGIKVGQDKDEIEIDFSKSNNRIINIASANGTGKSVLLSSLTPFAYPGNIDERNTLSYITIGSNGYKEIHYQNDNDLYVIKHYYKASKETHSVKSYISKNDEELNINGNVTSFLSLVEIHLGLTMDMMRLLRLGTNVNSFVTLKPADRKTYIGRLMEEIDLYLKIYRKINDDIRVIKILMQTNANNINKCQVTDIIEEENKIKELTKELSNRLSQIKDIDISLNKIQTIVRTNNLLELVSKKNKIEADLNEIYKNENIVSSTGLSDTTVEQLTDSKNQLNENRIDLQSKINALRMQIDNLLSTISNLESKIHKSSVINNITSLQNLINNTNNQISNIDDIICNITPTCTSNDLSSLINKLQSLNDIGNIIYNFDKISLDIYLELIDKGNNVDKFISNQRKLNLNRVSETDLRRLLNRVFDQDMIITPNCDTEYQECPYYRFAETINEYRTRTETEIYDKDIVEQIKMISNNIDHILNTVYEVSHIEIPKGFKEILTIKNIYSRLKQRLLVFDLTELINYLTLVKGHEFYIDLKSKLNQYERELQLLKQSGDSNIPIEIDQYNKKISEYREEINELSIQLTDINSKIQTTDYNISVIQKYQDGKKYKSLLESNVKDIDDILIPLEKASEEERELKYKRQLIQSVVDSTQKEITDIQIKINEYNKLLAESVSLNEKYNKRSVVLESVSTKKGIPLIFMNTYLSKIKKLTNELLSIIYEDELYIHEFNVTADTFEVSYCKNDTIIPDIRYASQSELSLITMALSFALAHNVTGRYNILLLDEIDAGLDDKNRSAFLKMLYNQMTKLNSEQVFVISHNLSQIVNISLDVIKMSDIHIHSKLQNIIYDSTI